MKMILKHKSKINALCKRHNVLELYVFGSVLTEAFTKDSDLDLLVRFGDVKLFDYFDNYMDFKDALEEIFKRKVDLIEEHTVKNPVLKRSINKNKLKIYGRADSKMAV